MQVWSKHAQRLFRSHTFCHAVIEVCLTILPNRGVKLRPFREDLKIKNMTASAKGTVEEPGSRVAQKSGLNGSILDQGWGIFFSKLDWKTLRLGGHVHKVPPQNTSRTCPICGSVSKDNRKTQALFKCVSCGHQGNADVIAAINIKERGRSSLACGESEKNAWAQVNSGRPKKQMPNQQQ